MKKLLKELKLKPVLFYPEFVALTGSINAAILLSQIFYWWTACGERSFYKTNEDFCQELCMTIDEFKKAKDRIRELSFVDIYVEGMPAKTYYLLDTQLVERELLQLVGKPLTSWRESHQSVGGNSTSTLYTENTHTLSSDKSSENVSEKAVQKENKVDHNPLTDLPLWMGNSSLKRLIKVYSIIWTDVYGFSPTITNWGQIGKQFKPLLSKYSEYQVAAMIALHFEWKGADGDNDFTHKVLKNSCFPLAKLPAQASAYEAYIRNYMQLAFDEPVKVKEHVVEIIRPLIKK